MSKPHEPGHWWGKLRREGHEWRTIRVIDQGHDEVPAAIACPGIVSVFLAPEDMVWGKRIPDNERLEALEELLYHLRRWAGTPNREEAEVETIALLEWAEEHEGIKLPKESRP